MWVNKIVFWVGTFFNSLSNGLVILIDSSWISFYASSMNYLRVSLSKESTENLLSGFSRSAFQVLS